MALRRVVFSGAVALIAASAAAAQTPPAGGAPAPAASPAPGAPDAAAPAEGDSDTWIFSGVLQNSSETFSGTLITGKAEAQFELKLAGGATCDGGELKPQLGLVRLSEIQCSDGRPMRALFVPQAHQTLKVFGHVGDARFATVAHLLGTQPIPEPKQTTAPHAPMRGPLPPPPLPAPAKPPGGDPG